MMVSVPITGSGTIKYNQRKAEPSTTLGKAMGDSLIRSMDGRLMDELISSIRNPSLIYPGQQIQIPSGGSVPAPSGPVVTGPTGDPSSNPYYADFVRAAEAAGVPAEWASNPALIPNSAMVFGGGVVEGVVRPSINRASSPIE